LGETMATQSVEWREKDLDRRSARQRTQIETAKLLATFAVSASAAIVASALQAGKSTTWNLAAIILLGIAFLAVVGVIFLDRTTQVDQEQLVIEGQIKQWSDERLLQELRVEFLASVNNNESVVNSVQRTTQIQVIISILSAVCATISLLH
ncbi:MAG: hypothetical protein ACRER3_15190, partial [Pseudomonas fluorescens]